MTVLKRILNYSIWTLIALLFALVYTRIILGPKPDESDNLLMLIFALIYNFGFIRIWLIVGSIITILYILLDVFYLNERLKNTANSVLIRLLMILAITSIVGVTHYILEKVIDVI